MTKPKPNATKAVREPAQVYLASNDSELLARLALDTGLSKAEVMRQGIRSFSREQARSKSPMLDFLEESKTGFWPEGVAAHHDDVLAEMHRPTSRKIPCMRSYLLIASCIAPRRTGGCGSSPTWTSV